MSQTISLLAAMAAVLALGACTVNNTPPVAVAPAVTTAPAPVVVQPAPAAPVVVQPPA